MRILFVCTGNTCRSPTAAYIARRLSTELDIVDLEFGSAGISAWPDSPASDEALLVALERGGDLTGHRARQLSRELVAGHDLILAMGPQHLSQAESLGGAGKVHLLTSYASRGERESAIADPFGGDLAAYRDTYDELEGEIRLALERVAAERGTSGR